MLAQAIKWRKLGISTIPLKPDSKLAAIPWKRYQTELPLVSDLLKWFGNGSDYNMGVITGSLVVLDFDCPKVYARWLSSNEKRHTYKMCRSYTVRTRRGYHVYLCIRQPIRTSLILDSIDIKASGGYVVSEDSTVNGYTYTVLHDNDIVTVDSLAGIGLPQQTVRMNADNTYIRVPLSTDPVMPQAKLYKGIIRDIKMRLPILQLVNRYTEMKSSGDGCYIGQCPDILHVDTHPSFRVVAGRANCFKSDCKLHDSRALDVIEFHSRLHNLSYRDSIATLAQELGLISL